MVGEVTIVDGKRRMCVSTHASYGGGSGPLFATEGLVHAFTIAHQRSGYLLGVVEQVDPIRKSVQLRILNGESWGVLANNTQVRLHANDLSRCHIASSNDFAIAKDVSEKAVLLRTQQAFYNTTVEEIEDALKTSYDELMATYIGESAFKHLNRLMSLYVDLNNHAKRSGGWYLKQADKRSLAMRNELLDEINKGIKNHD